MVPGVLSGAGGRVADLAPWVMWTVEPRSLDWERIRMRPGRVMIPMRPGAVQILQMQPMDWQAFEAWLGGAE